MTILLLIGFVGFMQAGNPILSPPPVPAPQNITVQMTAPPPDPEATMRMNQYLVAQTEYEHAAAPVQYATGLLSGTNIWTFTPPNFITDGTVARVRTNVRLAALSLFLLGIIYTGGRLAFGTALGTTSMQQLLPMMLCGFLVAWYSETLTSRSIDLCNWLNARIGDPTLAGFSGNALILPDAPVPPSSSPAPGNPATIPGAFFAGITGTTIYAIVLILLEVKMVFREAVIIVTSTLMPISGILWAFDLTRGWGSTLFRLFFGWLYGQPLVVAALALAGSLLGLMNFTDDAPQLFVKLAILFLALKLISLLAGGGLGSGFSFGLASLLILMRRAQHFGRGANAGSPGSPASNTAAAQPGIANGQGSGSAATGRPWRPALGTA